MKRTIATVAALTLLVVACGGDDDSATPTDPPASAVATTDAPPPASDPVASDPPASDAPAPTDPPATDPSPTTAPPTTEPAEPTYAEAAGLATIELSPTEAGEQPMLAWTPVDGAVSYRLAALTSDGSPYWAWLGEATEVRFGGAPEPGGFTAIVFEPMTWRVVAVDAEGRPIAASEPGDLTP